MPDPCDRIALLAEIAANAVAATTVQLVDGWLVRAWPDAPFRRCNSTLPLRGGAGSPEARIEVVEEFYRRRGLPVRFEINPAAEPPELDEILAARGYVVEAPTFLEVAETERVLAATTPRPGDALGDIADADGFELRVVDAIDDAWIAAYARAHGDGPRTARRIEAYGRLLPRLGPLSAAAAVRDATGAPLAAGFTVFERGLAGIFGMGTHPDARGRGLARAVLHALAQRARAAGARELYLQVEADNEPALRLYERAGFRLAYRYHYRSLDPIS